MPQVESTPSYVENIYKTSLEKLAVVRSRHNRRLTVAEKILFGHLDAPATQELAPGKAMLALKVDRVILQDATAQMAILQLVQSGRETVAVPTTVHCDHLIQARVGGHDDTVQAVEENAEVYAFLRQAARKYGMGFWAPGAGIIHQVVLETYAFPGGLLLGSDSHTPNMGGLAMIAIGVGGADAVDAMTGLAWEVLQPKLVGVRLTGELAGWSAPKDIILEVARLLSVRGGTNRIIEYLGPGARTLSATGKATITNMGAEVGATTSIFPYDEHAAAYMRATGRRELVVVADRYRELLMADEGVEENPEQYFEEVLEINLSTLEPGIAGPFTPDLVRPVSHLAADTRVHDYPEHIAAALVGSCTNSSYEDLTRAAAVAREARKHGLKARVPLLITPGSDRVLQTARRDGLLGELEAIGGVVLANACGPCIGQWKRKDFKKGARNTIVNSFNRNFPGRNDDNPETLAFVTSPEVVVAYALAGSIAIDPLNEPLKGADGREFKLAPPERPDPLPRAGYEGGRVGYEPPAEDGASLTLDVPSTSDRIQILEPFEPLVEPQFSEMPVLIKAKGKTTTDQISPAGRWLRFRGHLDRISDNMLMGAVNAWTGERGKTIDALTGEKGLAPAIVARRYKAADRRWVIVGDENYGEGSSREHAAMSPRWLGAAAVIAKSFARIHEANLKKQGILPLTFSDPADYEKIHEGDLISLEYLHELDTVRTVNMLVRHREGTHDVIRLKHTMTMEQLGWFHAGSALNYLRNRHEEAA